MSDIDNELLALAGDVTQPPILSTKRSRKSLQNGKKIKRRKKVDMDSESDMEMSSGSEAAMPVQVAKSDDEEEEQESRAVNSNPFPYEGIYIDLSDKMRIQSLSELEREAILGERQDELQKIRDRENVKNMVRARDEQSSKRSSGREKSRTGTTHEKAQKLDELKLKRQAKGKRPKPDDPNANQVTKQRSDDAGWDRSDEGDADLAEEQDIAYEQSNSRKAAEKTNLDDASLDDIRSLTLTRTRAAELCCTDFFSDYVKGMWVRVSVGFAKDDPKREVKYRVAEVKFDIENQKYYEVENQATTKTLNVVIANSSKVISLDRISNSPIQENEWLFLVGECQKFKVPIPTKKEISRKLNSIIKYQDWVKDEATITLQVRAKKAMRAQGQGPTTLTISERLRLESERDQAAAKNNTELVERLNSLLEQASAPVVKSDTLMSELNERNRRANREEIRRAEIAASELRRQHMKAHGTSHAVRPDPSARVKTNPRMTYETKSGSPSRATPSASDPNASPRPEEVNPSSATAVAAAKAKGPPTRFEEMVASRVHIDIDIGDF